VDTNGPTSGRPCATTIGDGFNILLQALPINGKIVLRPPKSDVKEDTTQTAQQTVREANDRRRSTRRDK
jgi:hypothetical protein